MYLTGESISCLKAFIDGWYLRSPKGLVDGHIMAEFEEFIEKKYGFSRSWCQILLFFEIDEHRALKKFFEEFDEHLSNYDL